MRYPRRSTLIKVAVYGGVVVLAATVWAWALGFAAWHGAVAGAVLELAFGVFADSFMEILGDAGDLRGLARFAIGMWIILLSLALSIVGAVVGVVLRIL